MFADIFIFSQTFRRVNRTKCTSLRPAERCLLLVVVLQPVQLARRLGSAPGLTECGTTTDQSSHQGTSDLVGLLHAGSGCCKKKKKMVQEVVIVAALRTPIGSFNGALAPLHAHEVLKTL